MWLIYNEDGHGWYNSAHIDPTVGSTLVQVDFDKTDKDVFVDSPSNHVLNKELMRDNSEQVVYRACVSVCVMLDC